MASEVDVRPCYKQGWFVPLQPITPISGARQKVDVAESIWIALYDFDGTKYGADYLILTHGDQIAQMHEELLAPIMCS